MEPSGNTKREILRTVSSIFDPLGFLVPVTFVARQIMQQTWLQKVNWDEPISPSPLLNQWKTWVESLKNADPFSIRRCLTPKSGMWTKTQLHVFTDASEQGFGVVAYLRYEGGECDPTIAFVMAKARVAPLKTVTIPRLELCAALMGARLAQTIMKVLRIKVDEQIFHSDSVTVLKWITATRCKFHTYVGNRIGEILETTKRHQWRHVPGILNPADDASRGLTVGEMHPRHRFLCGPDFLLLEPSQWPQPPNDLLLSSSENPDPEIRRWVGALQPEPCPFHVMVSRASNEFRAVRTMAFVLRFVRNARSKVKPSTLALDADEISSARVFLLKKAQSFSFADDLDNLRAGKNLEKSSKLLSLTPFLDEQNLLCVGGREPRPWVRTHGRQTSNNFAIGRPIHAPADQEDPPQHGPRFNRTNPPRNAKGLLDFERSTYRE